MKYFIPMIILSLVLLSCSKEEEGETDTTMSTPFVSDGTYKLTAAIQKVYYSNGTLYGSYTYSLSHDSSVTPGYLALEMEWKGSGVYRITSKGKATLSASGIDSETINCTTNAIVDYTLDTDGNVTNETAIQTGCGGGSSSITTVSQKWTPISGGFTYYAVGKDSDSNEYQVTYTFQKQSTSSSSTTEVEGTWITSCTVDSDNDSHLYKIVVTGTDAVETDEVHSDTTCSTDSYKWEYTYSSLTIEDEVTFADGTKGHKFSVDIQSYKYTVQHSAGVSSLNSVSACGYNDWVINTAKDVIGLTCGSTTYPTVVCTTIRQIRMHLLHGPSAPDSASDNACSISSAVAPCSRAASAAISSSRRCFLSLW